MLIRSSWEIYRVCAFVSNKSSRYCTIIVREINFCGNKTSILYYTRLNDNIKIYFNLKPQYENVSLTGLEQYGYNQDNIKG